MPHVHAVCMHGCNDRPVGVQDLVQQYQEDPSISVLLLTTKVGGLGLTLTAATRVIILGPALGPDSACN